jgi:Carboxylesterase family
MRDSRVVLSLAGFMSTLDANSPGNYGLMDIIQVLKFIKNYIEIFGGDPNKVTLVGFGSGAAAIGILLVSPKARDERTNIDFLILVFCEQTTDCHHGCS